ncbi:hypothetical protein CPB86DRAFT_708358 [Serendipita vermifera]|nr:hypothetical protein CPB86DRAFT_708358 [Serendipita vermifera]
MNSVLNGNKFLPHYLLADAASYLFGLAVTIVINVVVFPTSSEKELRQMLVTSLAHIESLSSLIARAYVMAASDEEMKAGDILMQTIRADFTYLTKILDNTSVEVNWSKYSMEDYRLMIKHIRGLQSAMFRGFNSLRLFDLADKQILAQVVLPSSRQHIFRIRRDIDRTLCAISEALGGACQNDLPLQPGYEQYLSTEREAARLRRQYIRENENEDTREDEQKQGSLPDDIEKNIQSMPQDFIRQLDSKSTDDLSPGSPNVDANLPEQGSPQGPIQKLKADYVAVHKLQTDILHSILKASRPSSDTVLRMEEKMPSLLEHYGPDHPRGDIRQGTLQTPRAVSRKRNTEISQASISATADAEDEPRGRTTAREVVLEEHQVKFVENSDLVQLSRALATVCSLLFSTETVINQLGELYHLINPSQQLPQRRARLHVHLFPARRQQPTRNGGRSSIYDQTLEELSVKEALAMLENRPFTPTSLTLWQRIDTVNQFVKTDQSIYALKTAAISSIFAVLFYAPATRPWFTSFAMQASLLAALVAFEPTLGQSLIMFVAQVLGSGLGTLAGLAILEIFHNVGGYTYNPYGICVLAALYALPLQYVIYEKPKYFVFGLLALVSCGSIIIHEVVLVNYSRIPFDSPALQTGKAFTALVFALGLILIFELLILRTSARRALRIAMGELVYSTLAYATMSQAYVRAVVPTDPSKEVPVAAVRKVERELIERENQIISRMLGISGLIVAAALEPSPVAWRPHIPNRLLQANGLFIDRLQEARIALGHDPFDPFILNNMIRVLSPYRRQAHQSAKLSLYLSATSFLSKSPLPHDIVPVDRHLQDYIEDAVILSSRLATTDEGNRAVKEDSFARYWFFILCVGDLPRHLLEIESVCREMFGSLEDDPKMK